MGDVRVFHNPSCSNSRGALDLLDDRGEEVEIVEYLHEHPDRATLERILDAIPDPPGALVRHDKRFEELGLDPKAYDTRDAVIDVLLEHPELMQRPVVFRGDRAVIARPPETIARAVRREESCMDADCAHRGGKGCARSTTRGTPSSRWPSGGSASPTRAGRCRRGRGVARTRPAAASTPQSSPRSCATAGALGPPAGLGMLLAGPTILTHGTDEQKERYLRPIVAGRKGWCQLFSEPGAGSDLRQPPDQGGARRRRVGVNGQKVWTSGGQVADLGMLIARTDPDRAEAHRASPTSRCRWTSRASRSVRCAR